MEIKFTCKGLHLELPPSGTEDSHFSSPLISFRKLPSFPNTWQRIVELTELKAARLLQDLFSTDLKSMTEVRRGQGQPWAVNQHICQATMGQAQKPGKDVHHDSSRQLQEVAGGTSEALPLPS